MAFWTNPGQRLKKSNPTFAELISNRASEEDYFKMMLENETYPDELLPETGAGLELERALSAIFIRKDGYGSRLTSILEVFPEGGYRFWERSYDFPVKEIQTRYFYSSGSSKDLSASIIPS